MEGSDGGFLVMPDSMGFSAVSCQRWHLCSKREDVSSGFQGAARDGKERSKPGRSGNVEEGGIPRSNSEAVTSA